MTAIDNPRALMAACIDSALEAFAERLEPAEILHFAQAMFEQIGAAAGAVKHRQIDKGDPPAAALTGRANQDPSGESRQRLSPASKDATMRLSDHVSAIPDPAAAASPGDAAEPAGAEPAPVPHAPGAVPPAVLSTEPNAGTKYGPKSSPAIRARARERIEAGESYARVAADCCVSVAAVRAWCKGPAMYVPPRRAPNGQGKGRAPTLTRKQCIDILREHDIRYKTGFDEGTPGGHLWIIDGKAHQFSELHELALSLQAAE